MSDDEPSRALVLPAGPRAWLATLALALVAFGAGWLTGRLSGSYTLPQTRAPGELDAPPSARRPAGGGRSFGIAGRTGSAAQALARQRLDALSARIGSFEPDINEGYLDTFYAPAHYAGWPGLCAATGLSIVPPSSGDLIEATQRYLVVGSFTAPLDVIAAADPRHHAYVAWQRRIEANCAARVPSQRWFTVTGNRADAFNGARLFDGLVAAARGSWPLPFALVCDQQFHTDPPCTDARRALARLDPSAIASITIDAAVVSGRHHRTSTIETHGDASSFMQIVVEDERPANGPGHLIARSVTLRPMLRPTIN